VNPPPSSATGAAEERFHYLLIGIEVESILRVDIRTAGTGYSTKASMYLQHGDRGSQLTSDTTPLAPIEAIQLSPAVTTLVYLLQPHDYETPGTTKSTHRWTGFLLAVGATSTPEEVASTNCPRFALDLIVVPSTQLKEHVVPSHLSPVAMPWGLHRATFAGRHRAHQCNVLPNDADFLLPRMPNRSGASHSYKPIWWNGEQKTLELHFSLPGPHSPREIVTSSDAAEALSAAAHPSQHTIMIALEHSFVSSLFEMELVAVEDSDGNAHDPAGASEHAAAVYPAVAQSMLRDGKLLRDTFHPIDRFFSRDYALVLHALVGPGKYKIVLRERMHGALAKALGVHDKEICAPLAMITSISPYVHPTAGQEDVGEHATSAPFARSSIAGPPWIRAWPSHLPLVRSEDVAILAGGQEEAAARSAAEAAENAAAQRLEEEHDLVRPAPFPSHEHPATHERRGEPHHYPDPAAPRRVSPSRHSEESTSEHSLVHPLNEPEEDEHEHELHHHHQPPPPPTPTHEEQQQHHEDTPQEGRSRPVVRQEPADGDGSLVSTRSKSRPADKDWEHPRVRPGEVLDAYKQSQLDRHNAAHHPNRPAHPDVVEDHTKPPIGGDIGGKLIVIRGRGYGVFDAAVLVLAVLVTFALCCIACALHCRNTSGMTALLLRCAAICPCWLRLLNIRKRHAGETSHDIQLKKTIFYEHYDEDDNL
jgi:hypothetical protein